MPGGIRASIRAPAALLYNSRVAKIWNGKPVYAVSELMAILGQELETAFPDLWVEGEVSGFKRAASGHLYLALKDQSASLKTVMFRREAMRLPFDPENGMLVLVRGRLGLYAASGDLQLYATYIEPSGLGAMQMALEQAKRRLAAEGLTDPARKRPIPPFPHKVGIVTSLQGAALHDVLSVLRRRRAAFDVVVCHAPVQGTEAPQALISSLRRLQARPDVELILLTRGGGSTQDLWAFNDEALARAVAASRVPVISAVGHEVDTVLCDLTADLRAPTPSVAAELLTAPRESALFRLRDAWRRMRHQMVSRLLGLEERLGRAPAESLRIIMQRRLELLAGRLDVASASTRKAALTGLVGFGHRLAVCSKALSPDWLARWIEGLTLRRSSAHSVLKAAASSRVMRERDGLAATARLLDSISPLKTLARGFAIATGPGGRILRSAASVEPGDQIQVALAEGSLACRVESARSCDPGRGKS